MHIEYPNQITIDDEPIEVTPIIIDVDQIEKTGNKGTGYYTIIRDHSNEEYRKDGFCVGNVAYVHAGTNKTHVFIGDLHFTYDNDDEDIKSFTNSFVFNPEGHLVRQKQIAELMDQLIKTDGALQQAKTNLQNVTTSPENSMAVVTTDSMRLAKYHVATTRNSALKTQKRLEAITSKIKSMAEEQSRALSIKLQEIQDLAAKAEKAIWTINLYLGKEEEIVQIKTGKPAPASQKITIRQAIRYIDEECQINPGDDGLDANDLDLFDTWLKKDIKNVERLLPETKGIIAMHARRYNKKYKDKFKAVVMEDPNVNWTYFLVRNGENLYRIHVEVPIRKYLFPQLDEFDEYFWVDEKDPSGEYVKVPLRPGTDKYDKAIGKADNLKKEYLLILLCLQGIMDRTDIFKPMPMENINICNPMHCEEFIELIRETENVITDGNPNFDQWQREINGNIEIGCRIAGYFPSYGDYDDPYTRSSRVNPPRADAPKSNTIHTIERKEKDRYYFLYDRTDEVFDTWNYKYRTPKVRASYWVRKNDTFFINIDEVTIDKLKYYATHQESKKYYSSMVPVLEAALRLKEREEREEEPFKRMIADQVIKIDGSDLDTAMVTAGELIKWWKFKNRTHRALLSDDTLAANMIVAEHKLRIKQKKVRQSSTDIHEKVVNLISTQNPAPVLIAHKKDNQYVAYVPSNYLNVHVTEQLWAYNRVTDEIALKDVKYWKTVDKRHERWQILKQDQRWSEWKINPLIKDILTDDEANSLIDKAVAKLLATVNSKYGDASMLLPLIVTRNRYDFTMYAMTSNCIIPRKKLLTCHAKSIEIMSYNIEWERKKDEIIIKGRRLYGHRHYDSSNKLPWEDERWNEDDRRTIWRTWEDNVKIAEESNNKYKAHVDLVKKADKSNDRLYIDIRNKIIEIATAKAYREYLQDFGDPELWKDHKEKLKIKPSDVSWIDLATKVLAERNIDYCGMTVLDLFKKVIKIKHNGLISQNTRYVIWCKKNAKSLPSLKVAWSSEDIKELVARRELPEDDDGCEVFYDSRTSKFDNQYSNRDIVWFLQSDIPLDYVITKKEEVEGNG